ncbi:GT2 family glycosyltransferase [Lewinella marina]|uniref:Glycosyl transferase family 2 n=1 Tax=Neolewinella marina TaxID=438751 RepID=A0A2G0CF45_9BACT|nr:glycosyltransferase family 2 protein [Neolewinella marina]NJB85729.1 GT2 family glycosyltransferase [Neolewinella marina]PHK98596.1 glycosyl transferase family 2 [Neolewinella marina]
MQLSIVIVSYNVRYFLEQCLLSVERATAGMETETWVVDNHSADGSVEMVRRRFPWARVIANDRNPGFSVANNQALRQARGKYHLLLNPDTLVEEDTFRRCYAFAEAHPDLGGLGVRMIDGSGRFLPESKRGLPTPWVAFTKAFGLARLFPRSLRFNRYHLGYLAEDETHEIEVLAGAFMWMRAAALEKVGLLDEAFFMYGEDIDLSYRLTQGGYRNYYYPGTSIIHYKGESTKRGSLNYVRVFYQAMVIFARKHFVGPGAWWLVLMMRLAIYLRALLTVVANAWQRLRYPLLDAAGMYLGLRLLKQLWAAYHFGDPKYFPEYIDYLHLPAYTVLWTGSIFLGGGYDRPHDYGRLLSSLGIGTLLLLSIYGLLPEDLRPSRALLVLGAGWAIGWTLLLRGAARLLNPGAAGPAADRRLLIVGWAAEAQRTLSLLQRAGATAHYIGRVSPGTRAPRPSDGEDGETIGRTDHLATLCRLYRVEEIIFCSADLDIADIQGWMRELGPRIQYRILPEASRSIIGSHRPDQRGTLYTIDVNLRIDDPVQRRGKWLLDRTLALLLLLTLPLNIWLVERKGGYLGNLWKVLIAQLSWVGYHPGDPERTLLPALRPGVLHPGLGSEVCAAESLHHLNLLYARDYGLRDDLRLIGQHFRALGRRPNAAG